MELDFLFTVYSCSFLLFPFLYLSVKGFLSHLTDISGSERCNSRLSLLLSFFCCLATLLPSLSWIYILNKILCVNFVENLLYIWFKPLHLERSDISYNINYFSSGQQLSQRIMEILLYSGVLIISSLVNKHEASAIIDHNLFCVAVRCFESGSLSVMPITSHDSKASHLYAMFWFLVLSPEYELPFWTFSLIYADSYMLFRTMDSVYFARNEGQPK